MSAKSYPSGVGQRQITILLAGDSDVMRSEVRRALECAVDLEVVGEAKNGRQALWMSQELRPEVVLLDISARVPNGLEALRHILQLSPVTAVLILSAHDDEAHIIEAVRSGAMGYLFTHSAVDTVCRAIREVHAGNTFFSPSIPRHLTTRSRPGP